MKTLIAGEGRVLLREGQVPDMAPCSCAPFSFSHAATDFQAIHTESLPEKEIIDNNLQPTGIRESWLTLPASDYAALTKAAELLNWDSATRFCSACGSALTAPEGICKRCPACGKEYFPALSPAIVVLVTRGEEALLVHARNFTRPVHALVAGFVETGESLEECVRREVLEETSLEIDDVRYFGSQSWPFPGQLMIGFTARYRSGEIRLADGELTSGAFFTRTDPPKLPTPPSLSRAIIDTWLEGRLPAENSAPTKI